MARTHSGTNQYIAIQNESAFDFTKDTTLTIMICIKTSTSAAMAYISKGVIVSPFTGWEMNQNDIDTTEFEFRNIGSGAGNQMRSRTNDRNIPDGTWHILIVTYNGGGNNNAAGINFYDNGTQAGETIINNNLTTTNTTNDNPTIGARPDGTTDYTGQTAFCAIWNIVLTDSQIAAISRGANPFVVAHSSNLLCYLPLEGNESATEPDFRAQAHQGVMTGPPTKFAGNPPVEHIENYL